MVQLSNPTGGAALSLRSNAVVQILDLHGLSVTQTLSPAAPKVCDDVTLQIMVRNNEPDQAWSVVISNTIPPGIQVTGAASSQGTIMQTASGISCSVGNLASTASATLTIHGSVNGLGVFSNVANATAEDATGAVTNSFSSLGYTTTNSNLVAPSLANPIPDQQGTYGNAFSYTFPANTFGYPDPGLVINYTASSLPPGISFNGPSRTFSGTPASGGTNTVAVTATVSDIGCFLLNTTDTFDISIPKVPLLVTADSTNRVFGQPDPTFTGSLVGVTNGDNITVTFTNNATVSSPPGEYLITPVLIDPNGRLANYDVTSSNGNLTVTCTNHFTVTSMADSGPGTLRDALAGGCGSNIIEFAVTGTIQLTSGQIEINQDVTLLGPGATNLTIHGQDSDEVFVITSGHVSISGLTLAGDDTRGNPTGYLTGCILSGAGLELTECVITGGPLTNGGGVFNTDTGTLVINRCLFVNNSSPWFAGALWNWGTLRVTNSTFSGNTSSEYAGAVGSGRVGNEFAMPDMDLVNCTIIGNQMALDSEYHGTGGVYADGTVHIQNTIIAGNTNNFHPEFYSGNDFEGAMTSGDYNLIQDTGGGRPPTFTGSHNLFGVDPRLVPLANNGGPTRTHGLAYNSPARNGASVTGTPDIDQRGVPRPFGGGYDIGAFEYSLPNNAPFVVNPIPGQTNLADESFSFQVTTNIFTDPDEGQTLTYTASNLPPNVTFDGSLRTFNVDFLDAGTYPVTVIATDDGVPPLSASVLFDFVITNIPIADLAVRITVSPSAVAVGQTFTYTITVTNQGPDTATGVTLRDVVSAALTNLSATVSQGSVDQAGVYFTWAVGTLTNTASASLTVVGKPVMAGLIYNQTEVWRDSSAWHGNNGDTTVVSVYPSTFETVKIFPATLADGAGPSAPPVEGSDGILYGMTGGGGSADRGTIYRINKDGTGFALLKEFGAASGDGIYPSSALIEGSDQVLYGTTPNGGAADAGMIFKINRDGSGFSVMHDFGVVAGDGANGGYALVEGSDEALYGVTIGGGASDMGTLYRMDKSGAGYAIRHSFTGTPGEGAYPDAGLIAGADHRLYGTTTSGGTGNFGTVFAMNPDGTGFATLRSFGSTPGDGRYLAGPLTAGSDGLLYGMTYQGGDFDRGTIFTLNTNGTAYAVLRSLGATASDARNPGAAPLVEGPDHALFSTTAEGGFLGDGSVFRITRDGSDYGLVRSFSIFFLGGMEGGSPRGFMLASDGWFYGVTPFGFSNQGMLYRFRMDSNLPLNFPPSLDHSIPDQSGVYGVPFTYTFPSNTFGDPDAGQSSIYTASGLPPGIVFNGPSRTFSETPTNAGTYGVTITATDNGVPPLSTNDMFDIVVARAPLTVTANNTNRPYGEFNPAFTGILVGVTNSDVITAMFATIATPSSQPGDYPITPTFLDPDGVLSNYIITTNLGLLTVDGVTLVLNSSGGLLSFCWPTNAAAFLLEFTDDLTPPVMWQSVTSGITTNAPNICLTLAPEEAAPSRFYRLRLP